MTQPQAPQDAAAVLAAAGRKVGAPVKKWSPLEQTPTLAIGEDVRPGMSLAGNYLRTERIVSGKFTMSQEKEDGKGVQYRHVLSNGDLVYGIWSVGELKLAFSRLPVNTYVELTYKGKEVVNGFNQHTFDFAIGGQQ